MTARFSGTCDEKRAVTDRAYSLARLAKLSQYLQWTTVYIPQR